MYLLTATHARPGDHEHFLTDFRDVHSSWSLCETADGTPPPDRPTARIGLVARESALSAFASPAGSETIGDLAYFAAAGGRIDLRREVVEP